MLYLLEIKVEGKRAVKDSKILVIDDEKVYQTLLSETFAQYQVEVASSGEQGIEKAQAFKPDLILLDVVMGGISGYEVCKALRKIPSLAQTPIVFISNTTSAEGRIKAYDIGANDFISKSVHPDEIAVKVENILNAEKEHYDALEEIDEAGALLLDLQRQNACMKSISLFMQASHYCSDNEVLNRVLFNTLASLQVRGIVFYKSTTQMVSTSGHIAKLERELMSHYQDFDRIHHFAHGATIFNWGSAVLLIKNVGELIDILAHLMDALEMAIVHIERQASLVNQVLSIESQNKTLLESIKNTVDNSKSNLKQQLFSSGLISQFDLQDEQDLDDLLSGSGDELYDLISNFNGNAEKVNSLLGRLRKPPQALRFLFKSEAKEHNNILF